MQVLGCVGAGCFGKVLKVRLGEDVFALKQVAVMPLRFSCSSTVGRTASSCSVCNERYSYCLAACTTPTSFVATPPSAKMTASTSSCSTPDIAPSTTSFCPYNCHNSSMSSPSLLLPSNTSRPTASYTATSNLPTSSSLKRDYSKSQISGSVARWESQESRGQWWELLSTLLRRCWSSGIF